MKKIAIVAFKGEMPCFVHALLNLWNYHMKGYETKLIIEGMATERILDMEESSKKELWKSIKAANLISSVCMACSVQTNSLEAAKNQGLPIDNSLSGHSDLEPFTQSGYEIIIF